MTDLLELNFLRNATHCPNEISDEALLLILRHQVEQVPCLGVIVIALAVVITIAVDSTERSQVRNRIPLQVTFRSQPIDNERDSSSARL